MIYFDVFWETKKISVIEIEVACALNLVSRDFTLISAQTARNQLSWTAKLQLIWFNWNEITVKTKLG